MATVYLAEGVKHDRQVAIRVPSAAHGCGVTLSQDQTSVRRQTPLGIPEVHGQGDLLGRVRTEAAPETDLEVQVRDTRRIIRTFSIMTSSRVWRCMASRIR